jgi:SAM-dependent methyltransferase
MHLVHRKTCRVCGSQALTRVIDLGEQYLQGSFIKPGRQMPPLRKIPTALVRCDPTKDEKACGLLQMPRSVPPEILYSVYWYRSGTNQTMNSHLRKMAEEVSQFIDKADARVLDIGCNDGTLLKYYPKEYIKFGIDPSDLVLEVSGDIKVIQDFFPSEYLLKEMEGTQFDIITSIAMFYDLEDPIHFVRKLKDILSKEGVWIFEMSYMPSMLKLNSYDTICHEHLEYYSLAVIEYILRKMEMKLLKAELNNINGGSIRCYATHVDNFKFDHKELFENIAALRREEFDLELDTNKPYRHFQERIEAHKKELTTLLKNLKQQGKKIHIYGASTKGNTILQWCEIDNTIIDFAAERNPDKWGAKTIGTDIPIISEKESREIKPDYYLVLPWHFKEEFIKREEDILREGTSMIFPLPSIEIISHKKTNAPIELKY